MPELLNLFLLAILGSIIALVGGIVFLLNKRWSRVLEANSIPFAAGVLITVSLLGLLPEAVDLISEQAFLVALIAFFGAYLFENLFFGIHHHENHEGGKDYKSSVPLVIIGDTIHNFIDGVAIGASFFVNPGLGAVTAVSTFLHEVPHEIGDFGILLRAGWGKKNIILINGISASMTIAGAFLMVFLSESVTVIGTLLAISAGIFLYLGASDFLPHIHNDSDSKLKAVLPLVVGVAAMTIILSFVPHS